MNYVEWLRVRNVLRVLAIILGVLIVVSLGLRIGFNRYLHDDAAFFSGIQHRPGATISHVTLPNGVSRTIAYDPKTQTRVTIDNLGYGSRHVVFSEPISMHHEEHDHNTIGSFQESSHTVGNLQVTTIDTNSKTPFMFFMAAGDIMALIIATVLGAPFARENDGHLEFALTRPASRLSLGLQTMGVDAIGILAASAMTIVAFIICQSMFEIPYFDFSGVNLQAIIVGIILPITWYAMLTAATASMKRAYSVVIGFAWPVAILVVVFATVSWGQSLVGEAIRNIFVVISRIDPLSYVTVAAVGHPDFAVPHFDSDLAIEVLLLLIYAALALYQWRRVEA